MRDLLHGIDKMRDSVLESFADGVEAMHRTAIETKAAECKYTMSYYGDSTKDLQKGDFVIDVVIVVKRYGVSKKQP